MCFVIHNMYCFAYTFVREGNPGNPLSVKRNIKAPLNYVLCEINSLYCVTNTLINFTISVLKVKKISKELSYLKYCLLNSSRIQFPTVNILQLHNLGMDVKRRAPM